MAYIYFQMKRKIIFYDEQFYSPKIKVAKLTYGATVRAERYHILCESLEYSYVLSGDTIYRMKKARDGCTEDS